MTTLTHPPVRFLACNDVGISLRNTCRYFSELRTKLCVDEKKIDWDDINYSFAQPGGTKEYLSTVRTSTL